MSRPLDRILALEAVRVTEAAAMRAFKLAGRGDDGLDGKARRFVPSPNLIRSNILSSLLKAVSASSNFFFRLSSLV